jgi:hypothetical protein
LQHYKEKKAQNFFSFWFGKMATAAWFDSFVASTGFGSSSSDATSNSALASSSPVPQQDAFPQSHLQYGNERKRQRATLSQEFQPPKSAVQAPGTSLRLGGDVPGLIRGRNDPRFANAPAPSRLARDQLLVNKDGLYPTPTSTTQQNWEAVGVGKAPQDSHVGLPAMLEPQRVIESAMRENEKGVKTTAAPTESLNALYLSRILAITLSMFLLYCVRESMSKPFSLLISICSLLLLGVIAYHVSLFYSCQACNNSTQILILNALSVTVLIFCMLFLARNSFSERLKFIVYATAIIAGIMLALNFKILTNKMGTKEQIPVAGQSVDRLVANDAATEENFVRGGYRRFESPALFSKQSDPMDDFAARMKRQGTDSLEGPRANYGYQRAPMDPTGRRPVSDLMRPPQAMNFDSGAVEEYIRQLGGELPNQFYQSHPYYTFNAHWANRGRIDDGETQFGIASSPGQMNRKWVYRQPKIEQGGAKTSHLKDIAPSASEPLEKVHPWMAPDELGAAFIAGAVTTTPERSVAKRAEIREIREEEEQEQEEERLKEEKATGQQEQEEESKEEAQEAQDNELPNELPDELRPIETMSNRKRRIAGIPLAREKLESRNTPSLKNPKNVPPSRSSSGPDEEKETRGDDSHSLSSPLYTSNDDEETPSSFAAFFAEKKQPSDKEINLELNNNNNNKRGS